MSRPLIKGENISDMARIIKVMTYDMQNFLHSSVQKYCELANIKQENLPYTDTPIIDAPAGFKASPLPHLYGLRRDANP